ncbi:MAG: hypothetical protein AB7I35_17435, partial [Ramlibacter sp.]
MSFVIVVSNAGPSAAANVTVTDVVPTGLNVVSVAGAGGLVAANAGQDVTGTVASLASGGTATLTIVVSMSNASSATLGYTNTASVTSTTPDPTPTNNTSTTTVTVAPLADVATVISLPANGTAGSVVTATITYTNNGTSTAANVTGSVVIGTAGGTITTGGTTTVSLVPGASVQLTVTFTVPSIGPVTGTSTVSTTTADANVANNVSTATMSVNASADLSVVKSASQPNGNTASATMSFVIVVSNAGPSAAANVTVTDV